MRAYNFDVRFIEATQDRVSCRVHLNPRFAAQEVVNDFPKNVTSKFLNRIVAEPAGGSFLFRAGVGNSIEIVANVGTRTISDSERAILLNLIDFGQDFETERSTTIDAVAFLVEDHRSCTLAKLVEALKADSEMAVRSMDELMRQYPSDNEESTKTWPEEYHDSYYYYIRFQFDSEIDITEADDLKNALNALHEVNMWTGYNPDINTEEIVQGGCTGISYEIEVGADYIRYVVERPACNPALSLIYLYQIVRQRFGQPARNSIIMVTGED